MLLLLVNALACVTQIAVAVYANCNHKFADGFVLKAGLFLLTICATEKIVTMFAAPVGMLSVLSNIGIALVLGSLVWRRVRREIWSNGVASNS